MSPSHSFRLPLILRRSPELAVLTTLLGALLSTTYLFPLKKSMHWDEVIRYAWPGMEAADASWKSVILPLFARLENGNTTVASLRAFHALGITDPQTRVLSVKLTTILISALACAWFSVAFARHRSRAEHRFRASLGMLAYALAPMSWLQANELMAEPVAMPLSLIWFAGMSRLQIAPTPRLFIISVGAGLLLAATSIQYFIAVMGISLAAAGGAWIWGSLKRAHDGERIRTIFQSPQLKSFALVAITAAVAGAAWFVSRTHHDASTVWTRIQGLFGESGRVYPSLAAGMSDLDRYLFGIRSFFWLYLPAWLLLIPALFGLRSSLSEDLRSTRFLLLCTAIAMILFAKGYAGNMQERYRYIPNMLLLLTTAQLAYNGLVPMRNTFRRFWKTPRRRSRVTGTHQVTSALFLVYIAFEYAPTYAQLPCFGNLQVYGPYDSDRGQCDRLRTVFGILPRSAITTFPHLSYALKFPNSKPGHAPTPPLSAILDQIRGDLLLGYAPIAAENNPNYLNSDNLRLMYLQRFGQPPPSNKTGPRQWISLSFSETSSHQSVVYAWLENRSEAAAIANWRQILAGPGILETRHDVTPQYSLRIAHTSEP